MKARILSTIDFASFNRTWVSPLRYSHNYISKFATRVFESPTTDLSLGSTPEIHGFEAIEGQPENFHCLICLHDSLTLSESFSFPVAIYDNQVSEYGKVMFSKGPGSFVVTADFVPTIFLKTSYNSLLPPMRSIKMSI